MTHMLRSPQPKTGTFHPPHHAPGWTGPVSHPALFVRHDANPILTAAGWPYPISSLSNPGAARVGGETLLLCRVEDRRGLSHLTVARSADGVRDWRVEDHPLIAPSPDDPMMMWGAQDPRVTRVDELGGWVIAYTARGDLGHSVALALTEDFTQVTPLGVAMPPDDRDATLLPRRVGGEYALLHRPHSAMSNRADVWLSRSPDLRSWHDGRSIVATRPEPWWDSAHIGMGPPPIETEHGWLCVYHGVKRLINAETYHVGLVLLDRDDPGKVLRRGADWVFGPSAPYETNGDSPNVVYPTGLLHDEDTDELRLYYGAADTVIALATAKLADVLDYLLTQPSG